jgi:hypothetical protein
MCSNAIVRNARRLGDMAETRSVGWIFENPLRCLIDAAAASTLPLRTVSKAAS